jgi:hypothetical protein
MFDFLDGENPRTFDVHLKQLIFSSRNQNVAFNSLFPDPLVCSVTFHLAYDGNDVALT